MAKKLMRSVDLARRMKKSPQMAYYIIHRGGMKYAALLAKIFKCERTDLLVSVPRPMPVLRLPKDKRMKGNMVSKS